MESPKPVTPRQAGDIITHPWLFTLLPLKAANQPSIQPQIPQDLSNTDDTAGPLTKGRAGTIKRGSKGQTAASSINPEITKFLQKISDARSAALAALSNINLTTEAVDAEVDRYLASLLPLASAAATIAAAAADTPQQPQQQGGASVDLQQQQQHPELGLPGFQPPAAAAAAGVNEAAGFSANQAYLLQRSIVFHWTDVLLPNNSSGSSSWSKQQQSKDSSSSNNSTVVSSHVLHEVANILLAAATWHLVKAAALVMTGQTPGQTSGQTSGTSSAAAMTAYKHYRTAAGQIDYIQQQLLPQLVGWLGNDMQPQSLAALQHLALAEAQSLTLQRAMTKSHQSLLIAGIAADTVALYTSTYNIITAVAAGRQQQQTVNTTGSSSSSSVLIPIVAELDQIITTKNTSSNQTKSLPRYLVKLTCYLRYQICYCYTITSMHCADAALAGDQGGLAVAWAQEAVRLVKHCYQIGVDYDRMDPPTARGSRQHLEKSLDEKTQDTLIKCMKDNQALYLQPVPKQLPPLPAGKRVADPLPASLPAAAALDMATAAALVAAVSGKAIAIPAAAAAAAGPVIDDKLDIELDMAAAAAGVGSSSSSRISGMQQPHKLAGNTGPGTAAAAGGSAAAPDTTSSSSSSRQCSCWRVCVLAICYPLLLLVSLMGIIVWLLLLPFKLCCCCLPCACAAQLMWNVVEKLIKAPLQGCIWAASSGSSSSKSAAESGSKRDIEAQ